MAGLGRNVLGAPPSGATVLTVFSQLPGSETLNVTTFLTAPVIRLTTVAEPQTITLLGRGLAVLAMGAARRRRS